MARVAAEGELSEEELPAEVLDDVENNLGEDTKHFAVGREGEGWRG